MEVRVLVFAEDAASRHVISMLQDDEIKVVGRSYDENTILDAITKTRPNIVILLSDNLNLLLRVSQQIYLLRPRSIPVVLLKEYTGETMQKIIQTGVNYIFPLQIDNNTLISQIKGIQSSESTRLLSLENAGSSNWKSNVITVFSSKGGVGKTTVATNLAVKLAQKKRKVAILDFDMEFGDIGSFMRIDSTNTISELLEEQTTLNADNMRKYMSVHSTGVNILLAPTSPEYAGNISSSHAEKIISTLRNYYDYLIIDTELGFNSINLSCFDLSSSVIYVTGMDLSTLRRTKKGLVILNSLVGEEKIKIVVAKEEPGRLKPRDVSRALELPLWQCIPFDQKNAMEAVNLGNPMVLDAPMSKVAKVYQKMADDIDGKDEGAEEGPIQAGVMDSLKDKFSKKKKGDR